MIHLGDITKIHGDAVPRVTIITGGSPCQDLSVAGKRAGLAGERSGLFMDQIRIIKEMRQKSEQELRDSGADFDIRLVAPRYMVWENVPGALSSGTPKGADFQAVLEETAKVIDKDAVIPRPEDGKWPSAGCIVSDRWSLAWRIHDAQWWGVAQRRKRICMLADFNGQSAGEILFELRGEADMPDNFKADEQFGAKPGPEVHAVAESLPGNSEQGGKQGQGAAEGSEGCLDDASYTLKIRGGAEFDRYGKRAGKGALVQTELSGTLGVSQDQTLVELKSAAFCPEESAKTRGIGYEEENSPSLRAGAIPATVYGVNRERGGAVVGEDIMPTLQAAAGESGNNKPMVCAPAELFSDDEKEQIEDFVKAVNKDAKHQQDLIQSDLGVSRALACGTHASGSHLTKTLVTKAVAFEPGAASRVGGHCSEEVAGTVRSNAGDNQQAVVYGIGSYDSNAMKSDNPNSGIYEAETSRTLDLNGGSPACNQGGMAVVQGVDIYNGAVTGDVAASITAGGMTNAQGSGPRVLVPVDERSQVVAGLKEIADYLDADDKATVQRAIEMLVCIEGNGARDSHRGNGYVESETMFTLNTVEQHAVAYRKTGHPTSAEEGQGWAEAEVNDTINAFDNAESRTPTLVVDQGAGKSSCSVAEDVAPTLATTHGGEPVVLENHPQDSRVKISEDGIVQTLNSKMGTGGGNVPMVMDMLNLNPKTDDICQTLNAYNGTGGNNMPLVMEPTFTPETAATRSAADGEKGVHSQMLSNPEENFVVGPVVASSKSSHFTRGNEENIAETLVATDWKEPPSVAYGLDRASYNQGKNAKFGFSVEEEKIGAETSQGPGAVCTSVVRRLTPKECERLQGFPDDWTNIGDWYDSKGKLHKGDSDSPRYKALGNSVALPFWSWLSRRITARLKLEGYKNITMASLFDGIGGFPLVFSRCGVKPVWASEIEEFPIAVTKIRFPEEETENG